MRMKPENMTEKQLINVIFNHVLSVMDTLGCVVAQAPGATPVPRGIKQAHGKVHRVWPAIRELWSRLGPTDPPRGWH